MSWISRLFGRGAKAPSMESRIARMRFNVRNIQGKLDKLRLTENDLIRQLRKLNLSVPENSVDMNAHKEGYVSYGAYAKSIILRKENIERILQDISEQRQQLNEELKLASESLSLYEDV